VERAAQRDCSWRKLGVHRAVLILAASRPGRSDQDAFLEIFRSLASFRGDNTLARWCRDDRDAHRVPRDRGAAHPSVDLDLVEEVVAGDSDAHRIAQARGRRAGCMPRRRPIETAGSRSLAVIDARPRRGRTADESTAVAVEDARVWRARR
jgi:hypothetical protein